MTDQTPKETELERRLRERPEAEEGASSNVSTDPDPEAGSGGENGDPAAALEEENASLKDQLLRSRAEFENFRKRTTREVERIRRTAAESLIHELLGVLDNLELALRNAANPDDPMARGVQLVHKQLMETLTRNGLEPIEAVGKRFDPNFHEAVAQAPSDTIEPDHVLEEFQRGYLLGGQILRPSKVVVSRQSDAAGA